jgi:hypothetical protein
MKRASILLLSSVIGLSLLLLISSVPTYARSDTATPGLFNSTTPNPAIDPPNIIGNSSLDNDAFGLIQNWQQTDIDLYRWYLVHHERSEIGPWIERADLTPEKRGYGLRVVDTQDCNAACNAGAVQIVQAEAGLVYTLLIDSRGEQWNDNAILLEFLDSDWQRLAISSQESHSLTWQRLMLTAQAPAGTLYIRVILYTGGAVESVTYWDNAALLATQDFAAAAALLPTAMPQPTATYLPSFNPSLTNTPAPFPAPTLTQTPTPMQHGQFAFGQMTTVNVINDTLNVRAAPGVEFEILEKLEDGTIVIILDGPRRSDDGLVWWRVRTPRGTEGWSVERADGIRTLLPR